MKALGLADEISESSDEGVEDEHDVGSKAATRVAQEKAAATKNAAKEQVAGLIAHNPKTMSTVYLYIYVSWNISKIQIAFSGKA